MAKKKQARHSNDAAPELPPGVKLLRALEGHSALVMGVAFDPQGGMLASGGGDNTVQLWEATSGKRLRTLEGHEGSVCSVAFAPQGGMLASGSGDGTVKLWEATSGKLLRTLEGHRSVVCSVAFAPQGGMLASGSDDNTVKLWEAISGKLLRTLDGHKSVVFSVAFDPQGGMLASGSSDGTVKLWEATSGKLLRTLEGHKNLVLSVAFDPQGGMLASGGDDGTVQLWEATSGKLLRTLEGHSGWVDIVVFSPDGRLLASKSNDGTIRLWNCETWETVAVIPAPTMGSNWIPALAFHPTLPLLATAGSPPNTPEEDRCREIHLFELDYDLLLGSDSRAKSTTKTTATGSPSHEKMVHSTSAKIVLVGDSGVGKTGLGWRLAHGEYREHDSTHGQQFWVLEQLRTTRTDGTLCEAVLWDLAGQPDYRLIHALSIQDADLALILFDPTNSRDPLGSAEYWLRQLPADCPKILVAARVDRGHPVLTDDELAAFCQRQGIAGGWIATSAREETGLDELLARMKQAIPWDDKPVITTDAVFKQIKDFVLALKESRTHKQIIFTAAKLREAIRKKRGKQAAGAASLGTLTDSQVLTAVKNLSSQGFVRVLTLSSGEEQILLVPELMNNLAASMVLEARRNTRGLGAVEESRLFDNSYRFRELEKLSAADKELLLDGTIEAFLANRLSYRCFREQAGEIKVLVFPDLMNLKKPQRDDLITENGASYILTGSTENTFAGLVVLLGYTNLFARTDQAHDVAWFESPQKEICGVRQIREDNERTIVLLFSRDASANIRHVFEGLVEQMLSCRDTHVRRVRPVKCAKCGTEVDRAVMARRLKSGKSKSFCEECGTQLVLPPDEPLSVKPDQRQQIIRESAVAERRTKFEEIIFELSRLAETEKHAAPTCFVSYAWGNSDHERWVEHRLAMDLEKAGIKVILDRWENSQIGSSIPRFVDLISKADRVLIVGTKAYRRKFENRDPEFGTVVAAEMDQVSARLLGSEGRKKTVLPVLLEGNPEEALPPALTTRVYSDFRDDARYFDTALDLLLSLHEIPSRHPATSHWKKQLAGGGFDRRSAAIPLDDDEDLPTDEAMKQALKRVGSRALHSAFESNQPAVVEKNGELVWLYPDGSTKPYVVSEEPEPYREP
ncbi:MAG: TIR domain-containing protein [Planctomycetota bacterium]|nr:TIR domain-containing protein [Planctomycetota bacterium]MDA1252070.1 TIR domain-containing protein [Planctomycetota bacterium]